MITREDHSRFIVCHRLHSDHNLWFGGLTSLVDEDISEVATLHPYPMEDR